mmetsp:Transcript_105907/g.330254  ORF Transcript_105907/g.330254 Transcript_105907/m.330254 type:complete len:229 (-) Transcript_105907:320-1006(-)
MRTCAEARRPTFRGPGAVGSSEWRPSSVRSTRQQLPGSESPLSSSPASAATSGGSCKCCSPEAPGMLAPAPPPELLVRSSLPRSRLRFAWAAGGAQHRRKEVPCHRQGSLCTSPPRATASKPTVPAVGHPGTAGLQMAASTRNMRPTVWPGTETRRLPSLRSPPRTRRRTRSPRGPRGQGAARAPAGRRRRTARGPSRAAWSRYPAWRPSTRDRPEGPRTPAAAAQRP